MIGARKKSSRTASSSRVSREQVVLAAASLGVIVVAIIAVLLMQRPAAGGQARQVPLFEVDPFWPKPLPNHWLIGSAVGLAVDDQDRIHLVHRTDSFNRRTEIGAATDPPTGDCCVPAPAVLVFNSDGTLAAHWGDPEALPEWPVASHRVALDATGNLWIGGVGDGDVAIRTFSADGRHLRTGSARMQPTAVAVDRRSGEVFVADAAARQVVVLDASTGNVKRSWGAYGRPADATVQPPAYAAGTQPAQQFRNAFCIKLSNDSHVYVCDRESNRVQVFRTDGSFVSEKVIAPATLGEGAVWDVAFSADAAQQFLYVADGSNMRVHVLDRRSLELLTSFGNGGRQPGQFYAVHSIAVDSRGNVYTAETYEGKRIQKFNFRGLGPAPSADQGTVWPRRQQP
jgi:DNA-binding beta-propeller fold protein YncE